ncbi:hypothetical protein BJ322DRAFT_1059470 [Thelephora terrestris]|uniref:F-box domain-containing protein n=1 Tax=Thelephora terrestris TaxID=56493 RepID=A0A9P6L7V5_9AGAM|nr:hypothetical protein BJ322DRAFT_1059470 [Thelephora terrestris]
MQAVTGARSSAQARTISTSAWMTTTVFLMFRLYAQRMTTLYASQNDCVPSDDILHLINLDRSGQILMPRLKLLNWTTGRASLPWLHHLLSPTLSVIHIDFNGGRTTPVNVAVIKALPTTNLKHIALSTLHTNAEVDGAVLDLILNSKPLKSVYIQQEADTGGTSPYDGEVEGERAPIELGNLMSMTVVFKTEPALLSSLFNRTTFPNIREIYVKHSGRTEWSGVDDLFDPMLRSASPGALHTLRYLSQYHGMSITTFRIRTLCRFVALRILRVTSLCTSNQCKFLLSDDDVSTIATAMPDLVELHLGGVPCASEVDVSINGIAVLAANCLKLTELQIHFDTARFIEKALDVSSEPTLPSQLTQSSCKLTQLIVGRISLSNGMNGYWTVATALLQIFPNLGSIKYSQHTFNGDWGEVMRIIKVQRKVTSLMASSATV